MTSKERPLILHIITGLNDGGAEAVLYRLVTSDDRHEHRVISLMGPGKYGAKMEEAGFEVSYVGLSPAAPSPLKIARLFHLVRAAKADVVQTWMYHADLLGGLAAWSAGVRAIVWGLHHTTLDRHGTKWSTRMVARINAQLSNWLPSRIITCSKRGAEVHSSIGYTPDKFVVVHNGHNTASFKPDAEGRAAVRCEFRINDGQLLLGCVARFNPQKDHGNLIQAFQRVLEKYRDAHLLLIGPGMTHDNTEVVELLAATGTAEHVTLVGPRSDIPAVMNAIDMHVLGSAFGEAFPNVLCEAMSCGTPCVATDIGDSGTIIGDTGRICPPRNPEALALSIMEMIPHLCDLAVAEACRQRIIRNFSLEHMVKGYQQVWQDSMVDTARASKKSL